MSDEADQVRILTAALGLRGPLFPLPDAMIAAARAGHTVEAVKRLRTHAPGRLTLVQAKRNVDALAEQ